MPVSDGGVVGISRSVVKVVVGATVSRGICGGNIEVSGAVVPELVKTLYCQLEPSASFVLVQLRRNLVNHFFTIKVDDAKFPL